MAELLVAYDPSKPAGQRLSPEVQAEIALLNPFGVPNLTIGEEKLTDNSVAEGKIKSEAVTKEKIAPEAVDTSRLKPGAVIGTTIGTKVLAATHVDKGIVKVVDVDDNDADVTHKVLTAAQYAAIGTKDPNTVYFLKP